MKTCTKCGLTKCRGSFAKNAARKDGLQSWCRECKSISDKRYYSSHKAKMRQQINAARDASRAISQRKLCDYLADNPCVNCGNDDIRVLQFHHRDPSTKERSVSELVSKYSWRRCLEEISKCDVMCANCHIVHHSDGTYRSTYMLNKHL